MSTSSAGAAEPAPRTHGGTGPWPPVAAGPGWPREYLGGGCAPGRVTWWGGPRGGGPSPSAAAAEARGNILGGSWSGVGAPWNGPGGRGGGTLGTQTVPSKSVQVAVGGGTRLSGGASGRVPPYIVQSMPSEIYGWPVFGSKQGSGDLAAAAAAGCPWPRAGARAPPGARGGPMGRQASHAREWVVVPYGNPAASQRAS